MNRYRTAPGKIGALILAVLLACASSFTAMPAEAAPAQASTGAAAGTAPAAASEVTDKSAELAQIRKSLTRELTAGWKKNPLYVDDIVGAAATKSQTKAIHRAMDKAKTGNVYVALLPELVSEPDDPIMLDETRRFMSRLVRDVVGNLGAKQAVVIIATATEYGRWEPNSYFVDANGVSASATSHFPAGVDTDYPAAVVSYGIRSVGSARAHQDLPDPNDAESPPLLEKANFDYWMDPDAPNLVTLILVALALAGSVMLIRIRARIKHGLPPTTLTKKQRRAAEEAPVVIRRIANEVIAAEPSHPAALDARDEIMTIDKAMDTLSAGHFPDDVRRSAALIALADSAREAHGVIAASASERKKNRNGKPESPKPCFFNPLHGTAAQIARWRGESRQWLDVPACAKCAQNLKNRGRPESLTVRIGKKVRPYWALNDVVYARSGFGAFENLAETIVQADSEARATT